jgi:hypothetical protein
MKKMDMNIRWNMEIGHGHRHGHEREQERGYEKEHK